MADTVWMRACMASMSENAVLRAFQRHAFQRQRIRNILFSTVREPNRADLMGLIQILTVLSCLFAPVQQQASLARRSEEHPTACSNQRDQPEDAAGRAGVF